MSKLQYENVFTLKGKLYARTYDEETQTSTITEPNNYVPRLWISDPEKSTEPDFVSYLNQQPLTELNYKDIKSYKEGVSLYEDSGVRLYGIKNLPTNWIRDNFPNPTESDHKFHTIIFDIETMKFPDGHKDSWKTRGEHACKAMVTSIQMYDTKHKEFIVLGLEKKWENKSNFTSPHGQIKYYPMSDETKLLKSFIQILKARNPTLMYGYNSEGYDVPFITGRVALLLDKAPYLYSKGDNNEWHLNKNILNGGYVKQLSPIGVVTHKEQMTNFGKQDFFEWNGIILEDWKNLFHKYTYTTLTSYSLSNVATHELGADKVGISEFDDHGALYSGDYLRYNVDPKKKIEDYDELDVLKSELTEIDELLKAL